MGGSPPGTVATTTDDAWRSAFESVFLGAVRLARILAADLDGTDLDGTDLDGGDGGRAGTGSRTGTGGSIVFVLASSVRVPLAELAISNGLFPGLAGVVKTLAGELGPAGIRVNGVLPVGQAAAFLLSPRARRPSAWNWRAPCRRSTPS